MNGPNRKFDVTVRVSADDWEGVQREILELLAHISDHGPNCTSVSGGYSSGHWVRVTEHPEMTHERYVAELETYLAARPSPEPKEGEP